MQDPNTPDSLSGPAQILAACLSVLRAERARILLVLGVLVGLELVLRWVQPQMAGLVYGPDRTGGAPILRSADGFRLPQEPAPTQTPERVILGLGDSTTFGTGVHGDQTWPLQMQPLLNDAYVVRNAGREGSGLDTFIEGLQSTWHTPKPEIVVLLVTGNMISFTDFNRDAPPLPLPPAQTLNTDRQIGLKQTAKELIQASALWKTLSLSMTSFKFAVGLQDHRVAPDAPLSPLLAYGWTQPDLPAEAQARMWTLFEAKLTQLATEVADQGSCLVIGYLPPRFTLSAHLLDNLKFVPTDRMTSDPAPRLDTLSAQLGVRFVDVGAQLKSTRNTAAPLSAPLFIPGDYTHLDPQGHALAAQSFSDVLNPILSGDTPCHR